MVSANFSYDSDFSKVTKEIQNLVREATQANSVFVQLNKTAAAAKMEAARSFAGQADAAGFKASIVDLTGATENFGQALQKNKLTMKQYFSEAAKAYKKDSQAYKLAVREVRRANSAVVSMGDVGGRRKGMLLTPDALDMRNAKVALEVASKRYEIFNDLVNKGATSLVNWGKNTQWAGRQLTVGLTVPISIFATKAIKAFSDVDKEITRFSKVYGSELTSEVTGSTEKMLSQIRGLGSEFARQYGIASSETIALAADLAAAGFEGQNLANAVNQTTRMMVLGEIDRQSAMKATMSLQTAFNLNSQELAQSVDYLNQVENQTSASLQDLTEAIPKAGPVIQALGGDVKDLSVLMTALREGGIASAEGANALKSGLASLISPTNKAIEVSKQFGIDLQGIVTANKGQLMPMLLAFQDQLMGLTDFSKAKVIEEIFGKYQFARVSALFDNLNQRGSQTVGMIGLMNKSADELAKQSYSELKAQENAPSTRLAAIQQQLTEQLVKVGADLAETVLPPLQQALDILSKVVDGFNNLPAPVKNFAKILGTIVGISGPILMLGGMIGNFIGNAIKFGMSIVNMFKRITGHPVQALQILTDEELAAKIAADQLSGAYYRQKTSVDSLNKSLTTYLALLRQSSAVAPPGTVLPGGRGPLPPVRRRHGGIIYAQNGLTDGQINGYGGGDKVPALLEPGEFVINKESSAKFAPMLRSINNGTYGQHSGGLTEGEIKSPGIELRETGADKLTQRPSKSKSLVENIVSGRSNFGTSNMLPSDVALTKDLLKDLQKLSALKMSSSGWANQGYINIPASIANTTIGKLASNMNDIIQMQKWMATVDGAVAGKSAMEMSASHAVGGGTARLIRMPDGSYGITSAKNFVLSTRIEPQLVNQQIQGFGKIGYSGVLDKLASIGNPELLAKRDSLARLLSGTGSATTYADAVMMSDFYDELNSNKTLREKFTNTDISAGKKYYNELSKLGVDGYSKMTKSQWITSQLGALQTTGNLMSPGLADIVGKSGAKASQVLIDDLYKALDDMYERTIGAVLAEERKMIQQQAAKAKVSEQQAARSRKVEDIMSSRNAAEEKLTQEAAKVQKSLLTEKELAKLGIKTYDNTKAGNRGYLTGVDGKTIKIVGEPVVTDGKSNYIETKHGLIALDKNNNPIIDTNGKVTPITKGVSVQTIAQEWSMGRPSKGGKAGAERLKYGISGALETKMIDGHRAVMVWTRAGWKPQYLREGGKLPGYGGGDKVPAMLEPGEFVINKEATKENQALLEGINSGNVQKKRSGGFILKGYKGGGQMLGQAAGIFMNLGFLPMMWESAKNTEGLMGGVLKGIVAIQGIVGAIQLAQMLGIGKIGKLGSVSGVMSKVKGSRLAQGLEAAKKASSRGAAQGMGRLARGARAATGARAAMSAAGGGRVLQTVAMGLGRVLPMIGPIGVAAAVAGGAFLLWRRHVDELANSAKSMYTQATEMAKVYNIELENTNKSMEKNAQYAKAYGFNGPSTGKGRTDKDYAAAVTKDFGTLIESIKNAGDAQAKTNMITAQYASLISQGFGQARASEITAEIARQANATAQYNAILPSLTKNVQSAGDAMSVIERSVVAQISVLGTAEERLSAFNAAYAQLMNSSTKDTTQFVKSSNAAMEALQNKGDLGQGVQDQMVAAGIDATTQNKIFANLFGDDPVDWSSEKGLEIGQTLTASIAMGLDVTKYQQEGVDLGQAKIKLSTEAAVIAAKEELNKLLTEEIDKINKTIDATNAYYDAAVKGVEDEIKAIEDGAEKKQKALEDEAKALQDRKDAIADNADFYIKQLEKEYKAEQYYQKQRETTLGGLSSLSQGDIFGYLEAQKQAASDASQFGREMAIQQIQDTADAAQGAIDGQLKKNQDASQNLQDQTDKQIQKRQDEIAGLEMARNNAIRALKERLDEAQELLNSPKVATKKIEEFQIKMKGTMEKLPADLDKPFKSIGQNLVSEFNTAGNNAVAEITSITKATAATVAGEVQNAFGTLVGAGSRAFMEQATGFKIDVSKGKITFSSAGEDVTKTTEPPPKGFTSFMYIPTETQAPGTFDVYRWDSEAKKYKIYSQGTLGTYVPQGSMQTTKKKLVQYLNRGGRVKKYGMGVVKVPGFGYSDTVHAMLTPGETVVDKIATQKNKYALAAMNAGVSFDTPNRNSFGSLADSEKEVYNNTVNMGGINININGSNLSAQELQKSVLNALNKATSSIQTNLGGAS